MINHVLSIQSHVATGYVGNRAAVFPLQCLGCEVSFVNTVQFSNHTGHGQWTGEIFSADHIKEVLEGLWQLGVMSDINAVLSGYLGTPENGQIIIDTVGKLKADHDSVMYCCDPVLGDGERDIYVLPETAEFIKNRLIRVAGILTPNQFELAYLTDINVNSLEDVQKACNQLHHIGIGTILVTSLALPELADNEIAMLLSNDKGKWLCKTPKLHFDTPITGAGDLTAAVFLAQYLRLQNVVEAFRQTAATVYGLFSITHRMSKTDLAMIAGQEQFAYPSQYFAVKKVQ